MKFSVKIALTNVARFIMFACFLYALRPFFRGVEVQGYVENQPLIPIWNFIATFLIDCDRTYLLTQSKINKWQAVTGGILLLLSLVYIVLCCIYSSDIWVGYFIIYIVWVIVGVLLLVLGLTKTIDDSKKNDKTIPYSD
jgi:hypothetical protein